MVYNMNEIHPCNNFLSERLCLFDVWHLYSFYGILYNSKVEGATWLSSKHSKNIKSLRKRFKIVLVYIEVVCVYL